MKDVKQLAIKYYKVIGLLAIIAGLAAWVMDWEHIIHVCIYCRAQRTVIAILGILMLLPRIPYLTLWFIYGFGLFGAYVAAAQVFLTIQNHHLFSLAFFVASGSLMIIIGLVVLAHHKIKGS